MLQSAAKLTLLMAGLSLCFACSDDTDPPIVDAGMVDTGTMPVDTGVEPDTGVVDTGVIPDTGVVDTGIQMCVEDVNSPNHDPAMPTTVTVGDDFPSLQICSGVDDWFTISLAAGQRISAQISFSNATGDLDLYLFDPADVQTVLAGSDSVDDDEQFSFEAPNAQDYLILVTGFQGAEAPYQLSIIPGCLVDSECTPPLVCDRVTTLTCVDLPEAACGGDGANDPNNSSSRAILLDLSGGTASITGLTGCATDFDFFTFETDDGDSVQIQTMPATANEVFATFLLDADGNIIDIGDVETEMKTIPFMPAGTWYLIVNQRLGEGAYQLDAALTAGACVDNDDCTGGVGEFCLQNGSCNIIDGNGTVGLGGLCDDNADCDANADFCFNTAASPNGYYCTIECTADGECTGVDAAAYCSEERGVCFKECAGDDGLCFVDDFCAADNKCVSRTCSLGEACDRADLECLLEPLVGNLEGRCDTYVTPTCGQADAGEPNDYAAVATPIALTTGSGSVTGQVICAEDVDVFSVTITEPSDIAATLTWTGNADLDVLVQREGDNRLAGIGFGSNPTDDLATGLFVAPGTYTIWVVAFEMTDPEVTFDLSITVTAATCADDNACLDTGPLRQECSTAGNDVGACIDFDGMGAVTIGGLCDTDDDCVPDAALCLVGRRQAGDPLQHFCTIDCVTNADCAPIPTSECLQISQTQSVCVLP